MSFFINFLINSGILFSIFLKIFVIIFNFSSPKEPQNLLSGLIISYPIVPRRNRMFFKILTSRKFSIYSTKLAIFFQFLLTFIVIIQLFSASGVRKPPLEFDNELLEN